MARIVLVHGAFNELWGPHELAARWVPALRDGLWHHGVTVDEADVAVCFYGDLFRRDPEVEDGAFEQTRAGVADMLTNLAGEGALAALSQAAGDAVFDRTVDMVTTMATVPDLTARVAERFDALVGPDTRAVVAHSMGSIVAYQALAARPDRPVDTLVTLGSPLGSPMIFDRLRPAPVDGRGAWPVSVRRWVNVAAVGDRAASVSQLSGCFDGPVEDRLVDNGHRAHDPEPYLNSPVTGGAVADALAG